MSLLPQVLENSRRLRLSHNLFGRVGNEKSARSFSDRSFFVDVRAACPCQNACFFFQHLEGLTEVLGRMSAGTSGRKLPVSADFSFLRWGSPKASRIKASHPHFPHFPRFRVRIFRIFRVFVLRSLLRPLFSWGGRDVRIFRIFAVSGLNR